MKPKAQLIAVISIITAFAAGMVFFLMKKKPTEPASNTPANTPANTASAPPPTANVPKPAILTPTSTGNGAAVLQKKLEFQLLSASVNAWVIFAIANVDYLTKIITWGTYVNDFLKGIGKDSGKIITMLSEINGKTLTKTEGPLTVTVAYIPLDDAVKFTVSALSFGTLSTVTVSFKTKQITETGTRTELFRKATGSDIL